MKIQTKQLEQYVDYYGIYYKGKFYELPDIVTHYQDEISVDLNKVDGDYALTCIRRQDNECNFRNSPREVKRQSDVTDDDTVVLFFNVSGTQNDSYDLTDIGTVTKAA